MALFEEEFFFFKIKANLQKSVKPNQTQSQ